MKLKSLPSRLSVLTLACLASAHVSAMDLNATILAAENHDPILAAAMANRNAAAENIAIARSRILPQLNAQGSYGRSKTDRTYTETDITQSFNTNATNSQLILRQGLFRARDWMGLKIGELQAEAGAQDLLNAQSDLWYRAVSAWVDVLAAVEIKRAQEAAVLSSGSAADQAQKRLSAGDGTKDVALEAAAQHELAKAQLIEAEQNLRARQTAYRLLVGQTGQFSQLSLPHHSQLKLPIGDENVMVDKALDVNPKVLSAKANEMIQEKRVAQTSYDHLPTLDLVGSYLKANNDSVNTLGTRYNTSQVGVQLNIPLFSGGSVSATERQLAANHVAAIADRHSAETQLHNQIATDWANYKTLGDKAQAFEALVKSGQDQRRATELGLRSGIKTWADVATIDLMIAKRASDYVNAVATLIKTQAHLLAALPTSADEWSQWVNQLTVIAKK